MSVNKVRARHLLRTGAALLLGVAVAAAPALTYAQHSMGGGGGHFSGGGGAHFSGGGHAAFGGGHYGAPHGFAGPHFAPGGAAHFGGSPGYAPHIAGVSHFAAPHAGFAAHAGAGWAPGNGYWHGGGAWGGGYWHGVFWPHVWYRPGFSWFLAGLPLGYATFYWGGLPYYYWNNMYYTWNPGYNGYVATDPPPVAGAADTTADATADESGDPGYAHAAPQPYSAPAAAQASGGAADVYVYPRNGQSDTQTQNDRYECHSWAVGQTGFDPTRATQQSGNGADYKRAMVACLDARGYSAR
jgi:hypothetical protein